MTIKASKESVEILGKMKKKTEKLTQKGKNQKTYKKGEKKTGNQ